MEINLHTVFEDGSDQKKVLVGIYFQDGKPQVNFPIGYNLEKKTIDVKDKEELQEILNLLKIIYKYKDKQEGIVDWKNQGADEDFPINAYMEIIRYYIDNGYYKERETEYKFDSKGKINWKRTIQKVKPFAQEVGGQYQPVYTNFVIRKNLINENSIITEIHKYCVALSLSRIGFLLGIDFNLNNFHVKMENNDSFKEMAKSILKNKLNHTNNDKLKKLFNNMLYIFENKDYSKNDFQNYSIGTNSFNIVWENIIDDLFGIPDEDREDYNPKTRWSKGNNDLIIDTIMLNDTGDSNGELFVLDAKYYKIGNLPGGSDINKQITYGDSVYYYLENTKNYKCIKKDKDCYIIKNQNFSSGNQHYSVDKNKIYNAFILPNNLSDSEEKIIYEDTATADWRPYHKEQKEHVRIKAIYVDTKTLLELVSKSQEEKNEYKEKLINTIKNN